MSTDLAAFLLARIAEDQAEADWIHRDECATHQAPDIGGFPCDCHYPARVLAECEARRRIVERAQFVDDHGPAVDHTRALDMTIGASAALRDVLRFLAEPYSSHPDYDPSWRP